MGEKMYEITVVVPVAATDEQVDEWVEYNVGYRADMRLDNPLSDHDLIVKDICDGF